MSEKRFYKEDTEPLPSPNTTSPTKQAQVGKRLGFGLLSLLALWTILPYLTQAPLESPLPDDGYLGGIADKGLRFALGSKDAKHNHDHNHKSHSPHKWVTPKAAEEIFLQIPNNSSARA